MVQRSVVLTIALLAFPATASGAGLRFTEVQPRTLSWSDLGGGSAAPGPRARLELCNARSRPVGPIAVRPVGFDFAGPNVTTDASVLDVVIDPLTLGGDSCSTVKLSAGVTPAAGASYDGVIVASAAGGNLARFRLTVQGPEKPTTVQPEPASQMQTLSAKRSVPGGEAKLGEHADLLVVDPGGAPPDLPTDGPLGVVTADSDTATVFADGQATSNGHGALRLPVRLGGAGRGATYTGKLTLTGFDHRGDKDAPTVTVSIVVQDRIWWAILAICLGLLVPGVIALLVRRVLPIGLLEQDCEAALDDYETAAAAFSGRWGSTFPAYGAPSPGQRGAFEREVAADIAEAKKAGWFLDLDGPTWTTARKAVSDARSDAGRYGGGGHDDMGPTLMRLMSALDEAEHAAVDLFGADLRRPPFFVELRTLLHGGPMPVDGAGVVIERATSGTQLARRWTELARRAVAARVWIAHAPSDDPDSIALYERTEEAGWLLAQTDGDDDLVEQAGRQLARIERRLLRIATERGWWRPGDPEPAGQEYVAAFDLERADDRRRDMTTLTGENLQAAWVDLIPPRVRVSAKQVSLQSLQWIVIGVALALGVLAGLRTVYFGKPFGTLDDYAGLILLGGASGVVSPLLAVAAKQLRAAGSRLPFLG